MNRFTRSLARRLLRCEQVWVVCCGAVQLFGSIHSNFASCKLEMSLVMQTTPAEITVGLIQSLGRCCSD